MELPEWLTQGKATIIQKAPPQWKCPKQLQTHYVPTNDVKNYNGTN